MKTKIEIFIFFSICFIYSTQANGSYKYDEDTLLKSKQRKVVYTSFAGSTAVTGLIALNELWYKNYSRGTFHFFNDNSEWLQMDKIGHLYSTYQLGRISYSAMKWAGFKDNKAIYFGGLSGTMYLSLIELMDGFSEGWGFSAGDMVANVSGSALFILQQKFWNEQKISCKFSFHRTSYPSLRPEILGSNLSQEIFKDYNGQSYWLSFNLKSLFFHNFKFPSFLNLAFGYGGSGMLSAKNDYVILKSDGTLLGRNRERKYFISMDFDLTRIKTKSKLLKSIFYLVNSVKLPFPALAFSRSGMRSYFFYY